MRFREFHYRWEFNLKSSPQSMWGYISDTNRFNRDTGVPSIERLNQPEKKTKNARRRLKLSRFGIGIEWEEEPFEWLRPTRFGVKRCYKTGPVAEMRVRAKLTPRAEGGTHLVYEVWARPRNAAGLVAIPAQIGIISARQFANVIRRYDNLALLDERQASDQLPTGQQEKSVRLAPGALARLESLRSRLSQNNPQDNLINQLINTIKTSDDISVNRLRPYTLADSWGVSRREVLELCLRATRAGLLDFRWDLLCPLCRGASQTAAHLRDLPDDVHCDSCQIDFKVNFDQLVELTFRPNAAIRRVEAREFCVGGPAVTPHIFAQQLLDSGKSRSLTLPLEEGRYRLRTMKSRGGHIFSAKDVGSDNFNACIESNGWNCDVTNISLMPTINLENKTDEEQLFILERMRWNDQAATAAEVTALQKFRDLFSEEALRPGDQISVGRLTIVFTDLLDSTRLYREIGDAPAFGSVMNHFDILQAAIADEEGALIKTIGDAVMAVFQRPASAIRAILRAQKELATPPAGQLALTLKAGVHSGHCIAVTLNQRLDYFGSTINLAARLAGLSRGNDIVLTSDVRNDEEVMEVLKESGDRLTVEPVEALLKGFDDEKFELWRIETLAPDIELEPTPD